MAKKMPKGEGIRRDRSSGDKGHTILGRLTKALLGGSKGSKKAGNGWSNPGRKYND